MHHDLSEYFGHKDRFKGAKLRNAMIAAEARVVDRAKLYRGEQLRLKAPKRKPKRKGHHGWRQSHIANE